MLRVTGEVLSAIFIWMNIGRQPETWRVCSPTWLFVSEPQCRVSSELSTWEMQKLSDFAPRTCSSVWTLIHIFSCFQTIVILPDSPNLVQKCHSAIIILNNSPVWGLNIGNVFYWPMFFQYFQQFRKKQSWPPPHCKCSKTVEVRCSCWELNLWQR